MTTPTLYTEQEDHVVHLKPWEQGVAVFCAAFKAGEFIFTQTDINESDPRTKVSKQWICEACGIEYPDKDVLSARRLLIVNAQTIDCIKNFRRGVREAIKVDLQPTYRDELYELVDPRVQAQRALAEWRRAEIRELLELRDRILNVDQSTFTPEERRRQADYEVKLANIIAARRVTRSALPAAKQLSSEK